MVGLCLVLVWYSALNSFFLVLSLTLQDGLGWSTLRAGLAYTPLAVCFLLGSLLAARLAPRLGRSLLVRGAAVTALGFTATLAVAVVTGPHLSVPLTEITLMVQGLGMGLFQTPLLDNVLVGVSARHVGTASGVLSTAQQIGGAVGVALIGVLYFGVLGRVSGLAAAAHVHAFALSLALNAVAAVVCLTLAARTSRRGRPPEAADRSRDGREASDSIEIGQKG